MKLEAALSNSLNKYSTLIFNIFWALDYSILRVVGRGGRRFTPGELIRPQLTLTILHATIGEKGIRTPFQRAHVGLRD